MVVTAAGIGVILIARSTLTVRSTLIASGNQQARDCTENYD